MNPLEPAIITALLSTFGNPLNLGILVMIFFVFLGLALKIEWEALMIVMIPSFIWLFVSLSDIGLNKFLMVISLAIGTIIAFALLKIMRR